VSEDGTRFFLQISSTFLPNVGWICAPHYLGKCSEFHIKSTKINNVESGRWTRDQNFSLLCVCNIWSPSPSPRLGDAVWAKLPLRFFTSLEKCVGQSSKQLDII